MGPLEQIIHTFNFIAPAWVVALFCVLVARFTARWWLPVASWSLLKQTVVSGVLGTAVLAGGLVCGALTRGFFALRLVACFLLRLDVCAGGGG